MLKLRELRKQKNLSMKELGSILGLAESTISLYENGKREPDIATLKKIANYFNVSVDELLGCNDSDDDTMNAEYRSTVREVHTPVMINFENMCKSLDEETLGRIHVVLHSLRLIQNNTEFNVNDKKHFFDCIAAIVGRIELHINNFQSLSDKKNSFDLSKYNNRFINAEIKALKDIVDTLCSPEEAEKTKTIIIPMYLTGASAGTGNWLDDNVSVEWMTIPNNKETQKADYMLKVVGDSMQPKFFDGDYILVKSSESIFEGEIGIFILNGESYIKKMGRNELISLNPAYEPIKLTEYDNIRCAGKVLGTLDM